MPTTPPALQIKIIKDLVQDAAPDPAERRRSPSLRALRAAFLPLNVFVRIDLPLPPTEDPATSNDMVGLRLAGWPTGGNPARDFAAKAGLPPPPRPGKARPRVRRVLAMVSCPAAPLGRYRLTLVRAGEALAEVNLVRRAERVHVIDQAVTNEPRVAAETVLISGTPKSGTTWLEKIVNAHPEFLVLHEANTLRLIDRDTLARHLDRQRDVFATRYIPWMPVGYQGRDLAFFLQACMARDLMSRLGHAWGARFVVDRTPGYADSYLDLHAFWEEARVVHIVRHPLDVTTSWLFHEAKAARDPGRKLRLPRPLLEAINERIDRGVPIAAGDYVSDEAVAGGALHPLIHRWRREQLMLKRVREDGGERFHVLHYEDLLGDFEGTVRGMFTFLGADPALTDFARIRLESSFAALSGGRQPGEEDVRSFFRKGIAGGWRDVLSPAQAAMLWPEVADTAHAFGYDISARLARAAA